MSAKTNHRNCPLCDSPVKTPLYTQIFTGHFSHKIACCNNCGFVYVSNTPSQEYYNLYYQNESKYEGVREHEAHDSETQKELGIILAKIITTKAQILDVGCSTGSLLAFIKSRGYNNVYGIDPAPKCRLEAEKKYHVKVGTFDINNFHPKKKYDFIIISQVLEHLTNIKDSINKISSWLKDDGYLFIGVPDAGGFCLNLDEPFGEFSTEHINFFTKPSLYYLMKNFTNEKIRSTKNILFSTWKKSNYGRQSIMRYIHLSKRRLNIIEKKIDSLPNEVIVWGVGALTRRLLSVTNLKNKVKYFVDSNPNLIGKKIGNHSIYSHEILSDDNSPILISSFKFRTEIVKLIRKNRYSNNVIII